jgi:hypothetical protein
MFGKYSAQSVYQNRFSAFVLSSWSSTIPLTIGGVNQGMSRRLRA